MTFKNGFENGFKVIGTPTQGLRGLVLWLKFNEGSGSTAYDSSFYNNHGTIYGATWTDGKFGKALEFDGVDDYVEVPDSESLKPATLTISAWIFRKGAGTRTFEGIVAKYDGYGGYLLCEESQLNRLTFYVREGVGISKRIASDVTLTEITGKWTHVAAVFDGDKLMMWVNGTKQSQEATGGILTNRPLSLFVGRYSISYFNDTVDEIRIYNRALSEEEIQMLMYNRIGAVEAKAI